MSTIYSIFYTFVQQFIPNYPTPALVTSFPSSPWSPCSIHPLYHTPKPHHHNTPTTPPFHNLITPSTKQKPNPTKPIPRFSPVSTHTHPLRVLLLHPCLQNHHLISCPVQVLGFTTAFLLPGTTPGSVHPWHQHLSLSKRKSQPSTTVFGTIISLLPCTSP